jgi:DNA-binding beta-propeller fold protein YncE
MKKQRTLVSLLALIMVCIPFAGRACPDKPNDPPKATLLWTAQDPAAINNPESAWYDEKRKCIWVANTTDGASPNAFISKLSLDGEVLDSNFLGGFIALRGTYLEHKYLYTNTLTSLLRIDLDTKGVTEYKAEGTPAMLNDIAMDHKGNVYVTDIQGDTIYIVNGDKLVPWITDKEGLEWPNGILIIGKTMYLSPWGIGDETWTVPYQSSVKTIDLATKQIAKLGSAAEIGSLDGIERYDHKSLLVNNWWNGKVYLVNIASGDAQLILDGGLMSTGDINYNKKANVLLVPIGNAAGNESHQIKAYKLE